MKRSEMVSKIAAVIYNFNEPHSYVDRKKCLEIAEIILQVQTENNILAPEYYVDYPTEAGYKYNEGFVVKGWEPEDEKK